MTPRVGVAFIVREKFGWALAALQRLYRWADEPFRLYFVDCGYPPPVLAEIDAFLADKSDVVRIKTDRFLLPNQSLNLAIEKLEEEYLCIVQNDVLIERGFMGALLSTFEKYGCDIVEPETGELQHGKLTPHRREFTDTTIEERNGLLHLQLPVPPSDTPLPLERRIFHFELHTLMLTARAAKLVAPFPSLNSREHIDLACHAFRRNLVAYANETAHAAYVLPPIHDYDASYFRFRWNLGAAAAAHRAIMKKWGAAGIPTAMPFVEEHLLYLATDKLLRTAEPSERDVYATD